MLTKQPILRNLLLAFLGGNLLLSLFLTYLFIVGSGGSPLAFAVNVFAYTVFVIIVFDTVLRKKRLMLLSKILIGFLLALLLVVFCILLNGLIQDMNGQQCSGFWGVETACIGNSWFVVAIIVGYALMTFAPALFFAAASIAQFRANSSHKRPPQKAI